MALSAVSSGMGCFGVKAGLYSSGKGFLYSQVLREIGKGLVGLYSSSMLRGGGDVM